MQILARMLADPTRYGEMVIKIQAGQIVHVHESQDHKPPKKIAGNTNQKGQRDKQGITSMGPTPRQEWGEA